MNIYPPSDWTKHPLHVAAMSGNANEVARLLSQGADVNENVFGEGTPMHVAIRLCPDGASASGQGRVAIVRLLLDEGAHVHACRAFSGTPLHDAACHGDSDIAELLLGYGADINSKDEDHRTPLHRAVASGKIHMVEFLISKGADVNAVADYKPSGLTARAFPDCGMTPLHVAAREGNLEIARQLVATGAAKDIKVTGSYGLRRPFEGLTAYEVALRCRKTLEERLDNSDGLLKLLLSSN